METTNNSGRRLSRRGFLGLGGAAALVAGASLAGCAPRSGATAEDKMASTGAAPSIEGIEWADEADAVICGYGAAGVAAAVEVTEAGGSALVLEMAGEPGGATRMSGGLVYLGGGTRLQKACGLEDSIDNMKAYVKAIGTPVAAEEAMMDLFCEKSPELFDWLEAHGVEFDEAADTEGRNVVGPTGISLEYSGNERGWEYAQIATPVPRGHTPRHQDMAEAAAGLFDPLAACAEDGGARVLYNAEVTSLIQDETGRVVGVWATVDGEPKAYRATKGVLLSTGAFTLNEEMCADYCPEGVIATGKTAHPNDMGSGIKMGLAIGAATRGMGQASFQRFVYIFGNGPTRGMLVDKRGLRIVDEAAYSNWVGRAIWTMSPEKAYLVMDDEMAQDLDPLFGSTMEIVASADTIEELARALDLEEATLANTMKRYNELAEAGDDADFHKDPAFLAPLVKAPFHAVNMDATQASFHSLGGLKINEKAEVISVSGDVIPGLYSAGRNACAIFGNYYGSGSSIAEGLMFGRFAGQSIAAQ